MPISRYRVELSILPSPHDFWMISWLIPHFEMVSFISASDASKIPSKNNLQITPMTLWRYTLVITCFKLRKTMTNNHWRHDVTSDKSWIEEEKENSKKPIQNRLETGIFDFSFINFHNNLLPFTRQLFSRHAPISNDFMVV